MARIKYEGLTKTATIQALKDRLKEPRDLSRDEQLFVQGAFTTFYPEHWKQKTQGGELISIEIRPHPDFRTPGYWLVFSNIPDTPISVKGSQSPRSDVMRACREAVRPVIAAFKYQQLAECLTDPITGVRLTDQNSDVDHYDMTFVEAFDQWVLQFGGVLPVFKYINHEALIPVFNDNKIKESWITFHNNNCHLRLVSTVVNQGILKKY